MKALRGRLIAELIPLNHTRKSGIIIVNRKDLALRARVLDVGATSMDMNGNPIYAPVAVGDIVQFKKYTPMIHRSGDRAGFKQGKTTCWWEDCIAYESFKHERVKGDGGGEG